MSSRKRHVAGAERSLKASSGRNPAKDTLEPPPQLEEHPGLSIRSTDGSELAQNGLSRGNGNFVLSEFQVEVAGDDDEPEPVTLAFAVADYEQKGHAVNLAIDGKEDKGWAVDGNMNTGHNRQAVFTFAEPMAGGSGTAFTVRLKHLAGASQNIGRFRLALTTAPKPQLESGGVPEEIFVLVEKAPAKRSSAEREPWLVLPRYCHRA